LCVTPKSPKLKGGSKREFLANVNVTLRLLYAIADPSVCRLSVVCNVGAPYSGG